MARKIHKLAAALTVIMFGACLVAPVAALDPRFKDADGDLVADTPPDPKDQVDPAVLIFAYTPVEDPAVYAKVWDGFLKHL
jgi:phosphonate transport system substrate-binding protein